jgi:hypothetical protein
MLSCCFRYLDRVAAALTTEARKLDTFSLVTPGVGISMNVRLRSFLNESSCIELFVKCALSFAALFW